METNLNNPSVFPVQSEDIEVAHFEGVVVKRDFNDESHSLDHSELPENIFDYAGYLNPSSRILQIRDKMRQYLNNGPESAFLSF